MTKTHFMYILTQFSASPLKIKQRGVEIIPYLQYYLLLSVVYTGPSISLANKPSK